MWNRAGILEAPAIIHIGASLAPIALELCVYYWLKFLQRILGILKSGSHILYSELSYTLINL